MQQSTESSVWVYGELMQPLYVGVTSNVDRRLRQHAEKAWWMDVRRIDTRPYPDRDAASEAEAGEIRRLQPKWNINHNGEAAPPKPRIPAQNQSGKRRLVTIRQGADYLGVSEKTIRRYIAAGRLSGFRMGQRLIRIDANELETLMNPIPTVGRF